MTAHGKLMREYIKTVDGRCYPLTEEEKLLPVQEQRTIPAYCKHDHNLMNAGAWKHQVEEKTENLTPK